MGGACSGGTRKQNQKVGENTSRFSELKSVNRSNQGKNHRSNANLDDRLKKKEKMNLEDTSPSPFSCELAPRPDKKGSNKVCFQ